MDNTQNLTFSIDTPGPIIQPGSSTEFSVVESSGRRSVRRMAVKPNDGRVYEVIVAHQTTKENPPMGSERSNVGFKIPYVSSTTGRETVALVNITQVHPNGDFPLDKTTILRSCVSALLDMSSPMENNLNSFTVGFTRGQI